AARLWVWSLSQPTITGLTKDPNPSMLVITPSPPAAAVPDRMAVGMDQKGPVKAKVAEAITVITAIDAQGCFAKNGITHQPAAATSNGPAACQRRSPARSEWRALRYCTITATPLGIADSNPTSKTLGIPVCLMMVGSQSPMAEVPMDPAMAIATRLRKRRSRNAGH